MRSGRRHVSNDTAGGLLAAAAAGVPRPAGRSAQAQAANGNIEGIVRDTTGAPLPGVTVTVTNTDTGTARTSLTNDEGVYRAVLLPLGRYKVVAELQGFKTFEQQGISLSAGQTALINVELASAACRKRSPSRSESPVAQPGKIDLGRTIGETEIKNLPLVSRNPYNFAFLQANVTGFENQRVRRAAHQRQRHADADELPDRRQHEHREGSRRPAAAAGVGGAGAGGQGHHQRLRPRVRPDDRHGLQRDHAVGTNTHRRVGELPLPAQRHVVAAVLPRQRPRASRTPRSTTSRRRSAGRSSTIKLALLRRLRVRRSQPRSPATR